MTRILANVAVFQLAWVACVLSGAYGKPWLSVVVALGVFAWHLHRTPHRGEELGLFVWVACIGMLFDSLLVQSGWLIYASPVPIASVAPVWILALWICFASTLNVSLRWLRYRLVAASVFGLIGGPVAYIGGEALGGVEFTMRLNGLILLAVGWAVIMPLIMTLAKRLDGWQPVLSAPDDLAVHRG